ncbi:MAG: matrixin family metalloprotease [Planctomycetota bacterium]
MPRSTTPLICTAATLLCLMPGRAHAINIVLDYTYDTNNFFGSGNPDGTAAGAQARATLESAADFFSDLLTDEFSPIVTPEPFVNGPATWTWDWEIRFTHPGTGSQLTIGDNEPNPSFAADEYRIYAGGRSISGNTLGIGGPGGFASSFGGSFFPSDRPAIDAISADFENAIQERGQTNGGFAAWGGAITFDTDAATNWHYDSATEPSFGEDDFFSVALHELGHALGLGTADEWDALVSGGNFLGAESVASYGGAVPVVSGHWAEGVTSTVFGSPGTTQEAALDPTITEGTRKVFTELDVAGLADIGWLIQEPDPTVLGGDYNGDGFVGLADLNLVLLNWGDSTIPPEWVNPDAWDGVQISQNELNGVLLGWGNTSSSIAAIPEPSVLSLMGLAGLAVLRRR